VGILDLTISAWAWAKNSFPKLRRRNYVPSVLAPDNQGMNRKDVGVCLWAPLGMKRKPVGLIGTARAVRTTSPKRSLAIGLGAKAFVGSPA
jgi:hypothetical protein